MKMYRCAVCQVSCRELTQAEAAYQGTEARWLFPGPTGEHPVRPDLVERALRRALRAAGIRKIRPHYCHAVPGSNKAAADAMEEILKRQEPGSELPGLRGHIGKRQNDKESS